ncbi:MAG: hypothetical protein EPGJADBJ_00766 [Saprospiraceae bacterium]|nr:hypothetical protein [Saprospiraceae bacterium]
MIIYSNTLFFNVETDEAIILNEIEKWAQRKTHNPRFQLDQNMNKRPFNGSKVSFVKYTTEDLTLANFQLSHKDDKIPGRQWITEFGLRKNKMRLEISILLETHEISTLVVDTPDTSVPLLVHNILKLAKPIPPTPSIEVGDFSKETSAEKFKSEVVDSERKYPIVLVSGNSIDDCLVKLNDLRFYLEGLAKVYFIPIDFDLSKLYEELEGHDRYMPRNGGISIVHPVTKKYAGVPYAERFFPHDLVDLLDKDKDIKKIILSSICHRYNLPNKLRHITREIVLSEERKTQFKAISEEYDSAKIDYSQWQNEYESEINELTQKLNEAEQLWIDADDEKNRLKYENEGLKMQLMYKPEQQDINISVLKSIFHEISDSINLEKSLKVIESIFADRVVILDSAWKSSKGSAQFKYRAQAFSLLWRLCTEYWEGLASGLPDAEARKIFGKDEYSAKESDVVASNERAQKLRTFIYKNEPVIMEKHLKHGIKFSAAETFRAHFEWFSDEKKIVIGHCGKHLDHG